GGGVGAAEGQAVRVARAVALRGVKGAALVVVVEARVQVLVVGTVAAGHVGVGVEVLLPQQERVAGASGDVRQPDLAALEDDPGQPADVGPGVGRVVALGQGGRPGEGLVHR